MAFRKLLIVPLATLLFASLLALMPGREKHARSTAGTARMQIGMNLAGVRDWGSSWEFVDLFKQSRPWIAQSSTNGEWDTHQPIALTPDGYPLLSPSQTAATLMCVNAAAHYPAGKYLCEFDGRGEIQFGYDVRHANSIGNGKYELDVDASRQGILLKITASELADPVRNIRVWMPGFTQSESPFHPLFVERLQPFKTIRFMDWQNTNNSTLAHWSDRTTPQSIRQSGPNGVAAEYMIELCNRVNADPWFCMPHLADDDFVKQFAELVKENLQPGHKIYVEWSNESWNTFFAQGQWVAQRANEQHVPPACVTADQSRRVWRIWQNVFGDQSSRLVRVAAGQQMNPYVEKQLLDRLDGEFDAVATSAYFWPREEDTKRFGAATTGAEVAASAIGNLVEHDLPLVQQHADLAAKWEKKLGRHIPMIIYEGGQHIIPITGFRDGQDQYVAWKQAAFDVQSDAAMGAAYQKLLDGLQSMGAELICGFSYVTPQSKWGSWGTLEYQSQPIERAPKYQALLKWTQTVPAVEGAHS